MTTHCLKRYFYGRSNFYRLACLSVPHVLYKSWSIAPQSTCFLFCLNWPKKQVIRKPLRIIIQFSVTVFKALNFFCEAIGAGPESNLQIVHFICSYMHAMLLCWFITEMMMRHPIKLANMNGWLEAPIMAARRRRSQKCRTLTTKPKCQLYPIFISLIVSSVWVTVLVLILASTL